MRVHEGVREGVCVGVQEVCFKKFMSEVDIKNAEIICFIMSYLHENVYHVSWIMCQRDV